MVIYSREKVARLREQYPAGTRICLNSMDGEAGMPQGLEGTVQYNLFLYKGYRNMGYRSTANKISDAYDKS